MSDWKDIILSYYEYLQIAINLANLVGKVKKGFSKDFEVSKIKDSLCSGELHFGDKVKVIGTFSEFLPFIDPKFFLQIEGIQSILPRTARLQAINDMYCGALFAPDQVNAFGKEVLPIFYGNDSKVLEHYTGEMLELQCQIIEVPYQYRQIINKGQNSYFVYEKEQGVNIPFGLKVLTAESYGLVDKFEINMWVLGTLNPAPYFKVRKKRTCANCGNFFAYLTIDPAQFYFDFGCITKAEHSAKDLRTATERFCRLEEQGKAYVVFPNIFKQFEVFYPSVDILNEAKNKRGQDVLLTTINEKLEQFFRYSPYEDIIVPKESNLTIDFQYDQLKKLSAQTFDRNNVPAWQCPHYQPEGEDVDKKTQLNKTKFFENRFKLKKSF